MNNSRTLALAIGLIAIGLVGMLAVGVLQTGSFSAQDNGGFSSSGQRIYYTGTDADGRPIPRTGAGIGMMGPGMMELACVDCHGEDGRGGRVGMMVGSVDVEDIRYSTLTASRSEDGKRNPGWTENDIAKAIREGVEPNGEALRAPMPRWNMTDDEVGDVIDYLKELDSP